MNYITSKEGSTWVPKLLSSWSFILKHGRSCVRIPSNGQFSQAWPKRFGVVLWMAERENARRACVSVPRPEEMISADRLWLRERQLNWRRRARSSSLMSTSSRWKWEGEYLPRLPTSFHEREEVTKEFVCLRFACEGLSYLSLDADVKEWIVEDPLLLRVSFF